jgi:hypothetical protein
MRTYFWISLFTSYRITANYLIEYNVILIANKEFKKIASPQSNIWNTTVKLFLKHPVKSVMSVVKIVQQPLA